MSVDFRQRTPGELARMVWRRKWLIVLPTAAVAVAVAYVVWRLPNVYESTTLLAVKPASIATSNVTQLSDSDLTLRINNISQEVTSRSVLEPLIQRYDLYARERARGESMDELVERMRTRDLKITLNTSRNDITNGFFLTFRGAEPASTRSVKNSLVSVVSSREAFRWLSTYLAASASVTAWELRGLSPRKERKKPLVISRLVLSVIFTSRVRMRSTSSSIEAPRARSDRYRS